jgi:hypothetical protein
LSRTAWRRRHRQPGDPTLIARQAAERDAQHGALKPESFDRADALGEASLSCAQARKTGEDDEMTIERHVQP